MIKYLFIFSILLTSLVARLNPFEPVEEPNMAVEVETLKPIPVSNVTSPNDGNRTVQIDSDEIVEVKKPEVVVQEKVVTEVVKEKLTKEELANECKILDEEIKKIEAAKIPPKPVYEYKKYQVLPFLSIDSQENSIVIRTRDKYKLIKYYQEQKENKLVFDFKGKVSMYTKRDELKSASFKSYIVGNHRQEGYFRVVIITKDDISKYKISMKNNIATIYKK